MKALEAFIKTLNHRLGQGTPEQERTLRFGCAFFASIVIAMLGTLVAIAFLLLIEPDKRLKLLNTLSSAFSYIKFISLTIAALLAAVIVLYQKVFKLDSSHPGRTAVTLRTGENREILKLRLCKTLKSIGFTCEDANQFTLAKQQTGKYIWAIVTKSKNRLTVCFTTNADHPYLASFKQIRIKDRPEGNVTFTISHIPDIDLLKKILIILSSD